MKLTDQLKISLDRLESINIDTPKKEIKAITFQVYSEVKTIKASEVFGFPYPTKYLNVLESTNMLRSQKRGRKTLTLIWVNYAKENLNSVIEMLEEEGL